MSNYLARLQDGARFPRVYELDPSVDVPEGGYVRRYRNDGLKSAGLVATGHSATNAVQKIRNKQHEERQLKALLGT